MWVVGGVIENPASSLIQTAHQQLGGPIVLIWNNLNTHLAAGMRRYTTECGWLTGLRCQPP